MFPTSYLLASCFVHTIGANFPEYKEKKHKKRTSCQENARVLPAFVMVFSLLVRRSPTEFLMDFPKTLTPLRTRVCNWGELSILSPESRT